MISRKKEKAKTELKIDMWLLYIVKVTNGNYLF